MRDVGGHYFVKRLDVQSEFQKILEIALNQTKIPELLIIQSGTFFSDKILEQFIVVRTTNENELQSHYFTETHSSRVEFWSDEDISRY